MVSFQIGFFNRQLNGHVWYVVVLLFLVAQSQSVPVIFVFVCFGHSRYKQLARLPRMRMCLSFPILISNFCFRLFWSFPLTACSLAANENVPFFSIQKIYRYNAVIYCTRYQVGVCTYLHSLSTTIIPHSFVALVYFIFSNSFLILTLMSLFKFLCDSQQNNFHICFCT